MTPMTLEEAERLYVKEYVAELRALRDGATEREMAVCRAWHGERFAWPGELRGHAARHAAWVSEELQRARQAIAVVDGVPTAMFLTCPVCGGRHIDTGRFATHPHATHSCQHCGCTWRPAVEPTCGVQYLPGFVNADNGDACVAVVAPEPSLRQASRAVQHAEDDLVRALSALEGLSRANRFLRAELSEHAAAEALAAEESATRRDEVRSLRERSNAIFHRLWSASVGSEGYDKKQWQSLESCLFGLLRAAEGKDAKQYARLDVDGDAEPKTGLLAHRRVPESTCWINSAPADTHVDRETGRRTVLGTPDDGKKTS
jgi:hypothetical protein